MEGLSGVSDIFALKDHTHDEYVRKNQDTALNATMIDYHTIQELSLKGHQHNNVVYITRFTVPTIQTGTCTISTELDMTHGDYYILDYDKNFSLTSKNENGLVLHYGFENEIEENSFVCLYWINAPRDDGALINSNITVPDITATINEPVDITGVVTDDNGNPITEGNVNFEISDNDDND